MLGHFSIIPFIAKYLVSNVGFEERQLSYVYFLGGAFTIFTSPIVGRLADKKGKFRVFLIFGSLAIIPVFLITNMPPVPVYTALIVTTFFFVFVSGRMIPMQAMVTSVVPAHQRGGFMSINSSFVQLGSGMAALLGGIIVGEDDSHKILNYEYVGYFAIAMSILCLFIAKGLKPAQEGVSVVSKSDE